MRPLTGWQYVHDWFYVYLMVAFDRLTPTMLGSNRAFVTVVLITMLTVTQMFMGGQLSAWLNRLTSTDCTDAANVGTRECRAYEHACAFPILFRDAAS